MGKKAGHGPSRGTVHGGTSPVTGAVAEGGGGGGARWFQDPGIIDLEFGLDLRELEGSSTYVLDADGSPISISDLSGNDRHLSRSSASPSTFYMLPMTDPDTGLRCMGSKGSQTGTANTKFRWPYTVPRSPITEYHWFFVTRHTNNTTGTSSAQYGWRFEEVGAFSVPRPLIQINAQGPANVGTRFSSTLIGSGGGVISELLNLKRFSGSDEAGDMVNPKVCLVEWRVSATDGHQQIWFNGRKIAENTDTSSDEWSSTQWGSANSGDPTALYNYYYAKAMGRPEQGFTEAKAAIIRAALMADFQIELWDGVDPTPN